MLYKNLDNYNKTAYSNTNQKWHLKDKNPVKINKQKAKIYFKVTYIKY